jgi:hypothetical protein
VAIYSLGSSRRKFLDNQLEGTNNAVLMIKIDIGHGCQGPWPASQAVREFKKQFRVKTGVKWESRLGMEAEKGGSFTLTSIFGD